MCYGTKVKEVNVEPKSLGEQMDFFDCFWIKIKKLEGVLYNSM